MPRSIDNCRRPVRPLLPDVYLYIYIVFLLYYLVIPLVKTMLGVIDIVVNVMKIIYAVE